MCKRIANGKMAEVAKKIKIDKIELFHKSFRADADLDSTDSAVSNTVNKIVAKIRSLINFDS